MENNDPSSGNDNDTDERSGLGPTEHSCCMNGLCLDQFKKISQKLINIQPWLCKRMTFSYETDFESGKSPMRRVRGVNISNVCP